MQACDASGFRCGDLAQMIRSGGFWRSMVRI
jgi:hypothetical protein